METKVREEEPPQAARSREEISRRKDFIRTPCTIAVPRSRRSRSHCGGDLKATLHFSGKG
jgi:hypothetical protein